MTRFAGLVRDTFNNATRVYITLEQELSYLGAYIDLERMKQSDSFDFRIKVDSRIEPEKMKIPNMVLQPYVENAIKHGVRQASGQGQLTIYFNLLGEQQLLECIIEDNGPGIQHSMQNKTGSPYSLSKGMTITDKRILTLNQLNRKSGAIQLQVTDMGVGGSGTGTKITIHFPI